MMRKEPWLLKETPFLMEITSTCLLLPGTELADEDDSNFMPVRRLASAKKSLTPLIACAELADIQSNIDSHSTGGSKRDGNGSETGSMMTAFNSYFTPLAAKQMERSQFGVFAGHRKVPCVYYGTFWQQYRYAQIAHRGV
ncbi:MAG: hypothetical protein ACLU37_06840 [Collinsella sp.]